MDNVPPITTQNEITLTDITIATLPNKTTYAVGETLDTTGLTLNAIYSDGSTKTISGGFSCTPTALNEACTQGISVSFAGKTTLFSVDVLASSLTDISIKTFPNKMSYYVGETLDTTGLTLTATYTDGSTKTIVTNFTCTPSTFDTAGMQSVTVDYKGKTAKMHIHVIDIPITNVSVNTYPTKMSYYVGEALDTSGLSLTIAYNDGSSETVTDGFTCFPTTLNAAGNQSIIVSYKDRQTILDVTVLDVSISSISINNYPNKTAYYVGDYLDMSGLALTVTYNDGSSKTITSGISCSPDRLNAAGTQSIRASYGNKTTTFSVSVHQPTVSLGTYSETKTMDCWNSYWHPGYKVPFWEINFPTASTSPRGGSVSWRIVSGDAFIYNNCIAAQQPGKITARATFTYQGYSYTADYTVNLRIYKKPTATNYLMKAPARDTGSVAEVSAGEVVYITEVSWDAATQASKGEYYLWGKTSFEGKSGWIVIS